LDPFLVFLAVIARILLLGLAKVSGVGGIATRIESDCV
jgi:hypothetical protein